MRAVAYHQRLQLLALISRRNLPRSMTVQLCCFQQHFFLLGIPLRLVDQPEIYLGAGHDAALFRSAAEGVRLPLYQLPDLFPRQCRRVKAQARLLPHGRAWTFKVSIQRAVQKCQTACLEEFRYKEQGILPVEQRRVKANILQHLPVGQQCPPLHSCIHE